MVFYFLFFILFFIYFLFIYFLFIYFLFIYFIYLFFIFYDIFCIFIFIFFIFIFILMCIYYFLGLEESLFKILHNKYPDSLVELKFQYRMNNEIMQLSNTIYYQNKMLCGLSSQFKNKLHIPEFNKITSNWIKNILDPK